MNCRTAQYLLSFDRAHAPELAPEDRATLGRHLAVCPECRAVEQAERNVDEALGRAMRDVEVPGHLEKQLKATLDREYQEERRRWWQKAGRYAAAAAAVLLLLGGGLWWVWSYRTSVDIHGLHETFVAKYVTPPQAWEVEKWFADRGYATSVPQDAKYAYLRDYRVVEFLGRQVPMLYFQRPDGSSAQVFILSAGQFDLGSLKGLQAGPSGYPRRVSTRGDLRYVYVSVHTGDNDDWLWETPRQSPLGGV